MGLGEKPKASFTDPGPLIARPHNHPLSTKLPVLTLVRVYILPQSKQCGGSKKLSENSLLNL